MYKPLADSTLMAMTKKEIIEQLRIAENNYQAVKETVNQQAENFIKLLAEERKHGHWIGKPIAGYATVRCSVCKSKFTKNTGQWDYCPKCGAVMNEVTKQ